MQWLRRNIKRLHELAGNLGLQRQEVVDWSDELPFPQPCAIGAAQEFQPDDGGVCTAFKYSGEDGGHAHFTAGLRWRHAESFVACRFARGRLTDGGELRQPAAQRGSDAVRQVLGVANLPRGFQRHDTDRGNAGFSRLRPAATTRNAATATRMSAAAPSRDSVRTARARGRPARHLRGPDLLIGLRARDRARADRGPVLWPSA